MHIGIDVRVLRGGRISGVQEYTYQLLQHLLPLDRRIQFTLVSLGREVPLIPEQWCALPNVKWIHIRRSSRLAMASMRLWGEPKLDVFADSPSVFFFPHFVYAPLSARSRRVVTFHDLSYERFPEFLTLRRRLWHRLQMRPHWQARRAERLIAVSHSTARDLTELYGIPSERIEVVHSGVDGTMVRSEHGAIEVFRRERHLPRRFVLSFCTREPRKNLVGLVRAFGHLGEDSRNADVHLYIVGGAGWHEKELRRAIHQNGSEKIHLVGAVPPSERSLWYSAASVLAYPSFFEGFGFPPLEAMALGTPVVASGVSSLPEVVGDAGILVDPYRIDELVAGLSSLLTDTSLIEHFRTKGYERAARFTWQRAAEETLSTLTRAAR